MAAAISVCNAPAVAHVASCSLSSLSSSRSVKVTARPMPSYFRRSLVIRAVDKDTAPDNSVQDSLQQAAKNTVQTLQNAAASATGGATKQGEVRKVTMAEDTSAIGEKIGKAGDDVREAVEGAVNTLKNAVGGDEGYDSAAQKGAFTTPQREKQKEKYDPAKTGDRPLQKTVDLANPFNKE